MVICLFACTLIFCRQSNLNLCFLVVLLMFWQQSTAVKVWRFRGVYQPQAGRTGAPAFGETKKESPVCVCVFVCQSNILIYSLIHTSLCPRGVGLVGSKKPRGDISNEGQTWHIFPQEVILWLSLSRHCCFQSCRHIAPQVKFQSNWLSKACYVFLRFPSRGAFMLFTGAQCKIIVFFLHKGEGICVIMSSHFLR